MKKRTYTVTTVFSDKTLENVSNMDSRHVKTFENRGDALEYLQVEQAAWTDMQPTNNMYVMISLS